MFPIYNQFGKVIGFTGRVFGEAGERLVKEGRTGKYVNSPETPIFQKSKLLYGFHKSKEAIRESRSAILVEGQMDFLMSWQDGLKNAVATSGTALTNDQLTLLKRVADQLVLSFDSDVAGQNAIERSIDLVAAQDFGVKVLLIPKGKDPADLVRSDSGAMARLAENAQPAMVYYFSRYLGSAPALHQPKNFFQQKNNLRAVLTKIKNIASPIEQSFWLKELTAKTGVEERILQEEMEIIRQSGNLISKKPAAEPPKTKIDRKYLVAQRIFSLVYHNNDFTSLIEPLKNFFPETSHQLFDYFQQMRLSSKDHLIISPALEQAINIVSLQSYSEKPEEELKELIRQLKLEFYRHHQKKLKLAIYNSNQTDDAATQSAMKEFDNISKELHNIINSPYEKEKTVFQKNKKTDQEEEPKEDDWF
jgi:DNA primase